MLIRAVSYKFLKSFFSLRLLFSLVSFTSRKRDRKRQRQRNKITCEPLASSFLTPPMLPLFLQYSSRHVCRWSSIRLSVYLNYCFKDMNVGIRAVREIHDLTCMCIRQFLLSQQSAQQGIKWWYVLRSQWWTTRLATLSTILECGSILQHNWT